MQDDCGFGPQLKNRSWPNVGHKGGDTGFSLHPFSVKIKAPCGRKKYCENRRRECIYKMIHTFGALFGTPKSKNAQKYEWIVKYAKFWMPVALLRDNFSAN